MPQPAAQLATLNFDSLVRTIVQVHEQLQFQAAKAINIHLTLRNWLIGGYIFEYEQKGKDRATYGVRLLEGLSERLRSRGMAGMDERELRRYRHFYLTYPQIRGALPPELAGVSPRSRKTAIREALPELSHSGTALARSLSFYHFIQLLEIEDPLKRVFYEAECLRGVWSARELKRQIATLYYERSGLSKNKKKLSRLTQAKAELQAAKEIIRDPYVFEFLGLKPKEVVGESDVENALLDKLEDFLLELGHGFCFEARQKRILIGGEHFFVDLVFYHRVLKCHVLVELKADDFKHQHLGQLSTYVSWYRAHEMVKDDNPPVGILLCTKKNHALVEYALAGIDNRLFVSKYQLELPKKEEMRRFLEKQMKSAEAEQ